MQDRNNAKEASGGPQPAAEPARSVRMGPFRSSILLLALMFFGFGALALCAAINNSVDQIASLDVLAGAFLFSLSLVLLYFRFRRE